jgi:hypothetical protein
VVRHGWLGWWMGLGLVLVLGSGFSSPLAAQSPFRLPRIELRENYPNPFYPATTIPFTIGPEVCNRGHRPVVSLKVYNVLVQVVAVPVLLDDAQGEALDSLPLGCGSYRAFWDGGYLDGKQQVTPGVYYYQLTVDGERFTRKMIAQRAREIRARG